VRAGLEAVLAEREGIVLAGSAAHASADVLDAADPDVLVLDAGTAEERPMDLPLLPTVLLLADETGRAPTLSEMDDGVRVVLPVGASGDELAAGIHAAAAGLVALTASAAASLVHARAPRLDAVGIEALTPREAEVLRWMVEGLGNKSIAARLGISDHTVKAHVAAILSKLDASTRTEAVAIGLRSGLVVL
jgi:DNA-binding NarL/FixJ family response regulator